MQAKLKNHWFSLTLILLTALLFLEAVVLFASDFDAIVTGQPAYEVSLVVVGLVSLMTCCWLLVRSQRGIAMRKKPI
ncbi:hypothetical protein [Dictyobacter aurantiacus]|uniref:Uncharacterized protein n=1 Tax=Dictyobacter aurantiacus TaxID=1936993 RepID=A0A401ZAK9_9CHLR|nr:hypothetical protein [Dictyobacter aurantiacus]GCE03863.1 hypothetical protein KDAU_11920 [Dictyobacter aurantiacus]